MSKTSWVLAKAGAALILAGFAFLTWGGAANEAYATILGALGQEPTELFPVWGSVLSIIVGGFLVYAAIKTH